MSRPCGDCGASPGERHHDGCDIERCPMCGGQAISCGCDWDDATCERRMPWTGEWPGVAECREYDLWCIRNPNGPGHVPCHASTPGASEDLNRLVLEGTWDRERQRWVMPERSKP
jgi:hypothetical protein